MKIPLDFPCGVCYTLRIMYTLIHRTGLSGGRVYNWTGDNITEAPAGAGNTMVGPWAMDYASFYLDERLEYFDSEFSGVLLDGRAMRQSTSDQDALFADLDTDESLTDSRSIIQPADSSASIESVLIRLYHSGVTWEDARVWNVSPDGSHGPEGVPLDAQLDSMFPGSGDDGIWHPLRHALRVPVMWAIYHIPLTPRYAGLTEMIQLNTANVVNNSDLLSYGPYGMLTAMHGEVYALGHSTRLYEAAAANFSVVDRGMFMMPYDSAHDDTEPDPDFVGAGEAGDASIVGTIEETNTWQTVGGPLPIPETSTAQSVADRAVNLTLANGAAAAGAILDTPAQRARGRIYTTVMRTNRDMRASPKRLTVWHFQTCPVRLSYEPASAGGDETHVIIGGLASPFVGPPVRLVYHEASARYRAR